MFIEQEFKKLELLKRTKLKKPAAAAVETKERWSVAKSWKPCAIGMLPCDVGSSGVDIVNDEVDKKNLEEKKTTSCGKREADTPLLVLDDSDVKKVKGCCCEEEDCDDVVFFRPCSRLNNK
ncbi:hypothetical protein Hanom_Chr14g01260951 [Helianthus anomalus]